LNPITIKLQMALNKRMYDKGKISYDLYSQTNNILISRLTKIGNSGIITLSEKPQNLRTQV
jgi:hypothetical protein